MTGRDGKNLDGIRADATQAITGALVCEPSLEEPYSDRASKQPVTVIVCTRDRPSQLARALTAISNSGLRRRDQIIVVDSASVSIDTGEVARSAGAQLIRVDEPGLSRARNAGVAAARCDIIAFTDDDCEPAPGWLDAMRSSFIDPSIGFVTGRILPIGEGTASAIDSDIPKRYTGVQDPFGIGHGANMAFRRAAISRFDEDLGAGARFKSAEDTDMFWRCLSLGWDALYYPSSLVYHEQWRIGMKASANLYFGYGLGGGAFRGKVTRTHPRAGLRLFGRAVWRQGAKSCVYAFEERSAQGLLQSSSWLVGALLGLVCGVCLSGDSSLRR